MTSNHTLITGATSSIGTAIANRLSETRSLLLHGTKERNLHSIKESCSKGFSSRTWNCDFSAPDRIKTSLVEVLKENDTTVDALVHCAGVHHVSHTRLLDISTINRVFAINTISAMAIISTLLKKNVNNGQLKCIIFISSISSQVGVRGFGLYSASKAALDSMMRSLSVELAPNVRLNSILVGAIGGTRTFNSLTEISDGKDIKKRIPLGQGSVDDVALTAEFLLSSNAKWITGHSFVLDGGQSVNSTLT